MKTYKKIYFGLGLAVVLAAIWFIFPGRSLALMSKSDAQQCASNLNFVDIGHIQCVFGSQKIFFVDQNPTDNLDNSNKDYKASINNYANESSAGVFCQDEVDYINLFGGNLKLDDAGSKITGQVSISYATPGKSGCDTYNQDNAQIGSSGNVSILLAGDNTTGQPNVQSLADVDKSDSISGLNFSRYASGAYDPSTNVALFTNGFDINKCQGSILAVYLSGTSGSTATEYDVGGGGDALSTKTNLKKLPPNTCGISKLNFGLGDSGTVGIKPAITNVSPSQVGNTCSVDKPAPDGYTCQCSHDEGGNTCALVPSAPQPTSASPTCESNFDSGFEWIICGALRLADKAAGGFNTFVDNQLCFNTGTTSSTGGVVCKGNDNLNDNVKAAWGIFKNLATALLVIVMLIMVISQAIGGGPFDAYTVRKMLPKLVIAVILMQLSWVIFKWTIDLSNDFGQGIQSLLYAPFGGSSNMQLDKLIGNGVQTLPTAGNDGWALFTILAAGTALIANLPGLLTVALFVVVSLATAFFVLILRKIIILLLVILAPVALIAWILPGTQRYWKMWQENFTKLLLMFPLIMGLIAGGRIFAYIVSGGTQPASGLMPHLGVAHVAGLPIPYVASVTSFADIAIIMFAYFGPYLLMPKAFTWGGQFLSAAASQVNERINKPAMEKGTQGVKGISERYHGRFGKAYNPNSNVLSRGLYRVASGHYNPFSSRSKRLAIAEGDKWSQERDEQALALIKRRGEKVMSEGYETYRRDEDGHILSATRFRRDAAGNYLDKDGAITDDIDKAREIATSKSDYAKKSLSGVAAMKQMWVDLAETGDKSESKMAVRQLIATSSWPEVQGSYTPSGVKVIDTKAWSPSVTTSPEDYPKVLRSRVDATPHIDDAANKALDEELRANPTMTKEQQLRFKSQFRVQYAIEKQLDNEGFQTQSDGFWQEAARMAEVKPGMSAEEVHQAALIQNSLRTRFQAIHDIGGTAPMQLLGHLKNGGELQANVEKALGGVNLDTYISSRAPAPGP